MLLDDKTEEMTDAAAEDAADAAAEEASGMLVAVSGTTLDWREMPSWAEMRGAEERRRRRVGRERERESMVVVVAIRWDLIDLILMELELDCEDEILKCLHMYAVLPLNKTSILTIPNYLSISSSSRPLRSARHNGRHSLALRLSYFTSLPLRRSTGTAPMAGTSFSHRKAKSFAGGPSKCLGRRTWGLRVVL
ncbi:hypothetical protein BDV95DRAFT_138243 [Massariosphaeria phaeospora]|uniref:Uncharacterized protein n=1 Tax=Massariosphaeria phaeospora TaxID=100035 RepID=A0A7C8MX48_9PLEO|nr:hypothetical protein BDV95DRAFT_138243 [Massariosphaeria phaeospora]